MKEKKNNVIKSQANTQIILKNNDSGGSGVLSDIMDKIDDIRTKPKQASEDSISSNKTYIKNFRRVFTGANNIFSPVAKNTTDYSQSLDTITSGIEKILKSVEGIKEITHLLHDTKKFENTLLKKENAYHEVLKNLGADKKETKSFAEAEQEEQFQKDQISALKDLKKSIDDLSIMINKNATETVSSGGGGESIVSKAVEAFAGFELFRKIKNKITGGGTEPTAKPNTKPGTKPDTQTNTKPNTKPDTQTGTKPGTKTDVKPNTQTSVKTDAPKKSFAGRLFDAAKDKAKNIAGKVAEGGAKVAEGGKKFGSKLLGDAGNSISKTVGTGLKSAPKALGGLLRFGGTALKGAGSFVAPLIAGAEIASLYNDDSLTKEEKKEQIAGATGAGIGGAIGGAIGTLLPIPGGMILGSMAGQWLGRKAGEFFGRADPKEYQKTIEEAQKQAEENANRNNGLDLASALDNDEVQDALSNMSDTLDSYDKAIENSYKDKDKAVHINHEEANEIPEYKKRLLEQRDRMKKELSDDADYLKYASSLTEKERESLGITDFKDDNGKLSATIDKSSDGYKNWLLRNNNDNAKTLTTGIMSDNIPKRLTNEREEVKRNIRNNSIILEKSSAPTAPPVVNNVTNNYVNNTTSNSSTVNNGGGRNRSPIFANNPVPAMIFSGSGFGIQAR